MSEIAVQELTDEEAAALVEAERIIERGLKTFMDTGRALARIRDGRLYRTEYGSFEAYLEQRFSMSRTYGYRLIQAVEAVLPIGDTGYRLPGNEAQARELARVPEADRAEVWREANERSDGRPTAELIRQVFKERRAPATEPAADVKPDVQSAVPNESPVPPAVTEQLAGASTPTRACEGCGLELPHSEAEAGFMRCNECDSDGDHTADADGECGICGPGETRDGLATPGLAAEPVVPEPDVWAPEPAGGGAVTSATPGNATAEAPGDPDPDVEYRPWRQSARSELDRAREALRLLTGDMLDADAVAQRADDRLVDELTKLAEELTTFVSQVRALRTPRVWIAAKRKGIDYHRLGEPGSTMCGRSTRTGSTVFSVSEVERNWGGKPCPRCWPKDLIAPAPRAEWRASCEQCSTELATDMAHAGYKRCEDCDPEGEHFAVDFTDARARTTWPPGPCVVCGAPGSPERAAAVAEVGAGVRARGGGGIAVSRKHNCRHNRSKSRYPERLRARGQSSATVRMLDLDTLRHVQARRYALEPASAEGSRR